MKAFTAILMFCLPMAAMGETYICTEYMNSIVSQIGAYASGKDLISDGIVTSVDTEKGFRDLKRESFYKGTCQKSEIQIACISELDDDLGNLFQRILIDLEDMVYTAVTQQQIREDQAVQSQYGTCTKL